jgi:BACON domain-containing protein/all-beta uncharacterized protein
MWSTAGWTGVLFIAAASLASCGSHPTTPTPPACTFTLSGSNLTIPADGGSNTVTVSTGSKCSWIAQADAEWVSIASGATGTGPGSVNFTVARNSATEPRSCHLTIAGQSVGITQEGRTVTCSYEIAPAGAAYLMEGGAGSVAVMAPETCAWTASTTSAWITVSPASAQGSGSGTVSYTVARNSEIGARTGAITIGGRTFPISQAGDTASCVYSVAPVQFSPCMPATQLTTTLTTPAGCPWTAATDSPWITIAGAPFGNGPASIAFSVTANWDAPRAGILMLRWPTATAGQNVQVAQAGCRYAVSQSTITVPSAGGSASFDVLQESDPYTCGGPLQNACVWSAVADVSWITITGTMPKAGDDRVSFTVSPNAGAARAGTIAVRDRIVRVTQAGAG